MRAPIFLLGLTAVLGCGSSPRHDGTPGAGLDAGASPRDASGSDAPGSIDATSDGAFRAEHAYCADCIRARCSDWAGAIECLDDPECVRVARCIESCEDMACTIACGAGDETRFQHALNGLLACALHDCDAACYGPIEGGVPMCQPLGRPCDPLVPAIATCCEGTCPPDGTWFCCDSDGPCTADNHCCPGTHCNVAAGRCEVQTCVARTEDCTITGLPCCDERLSCVDDGEPLAAPLCCAPDGTVLSHGESDLCCSRVATSNGDETITCTR